MLHGGGTGERITDDSIVFLNYPPHACSKERCKGLVSVPSVL